MSFILDALKKSENERQRTIGPSLADAPVRVAQSERPWWAFAVAALLVVNLAVLMIVLMRDGTSADTSSATSAVTAVAATPAPVARQPPAASTEFRPATNPAVRSLAEEAGVPGDAYYDADTSVDAQGYIDPAHPDVAAAAHVPAGPPLVRPIDPPSVAPLTSRSAFESRGAGGSSGEVLPTASALVASGTSLPDMRLDIHVYSNNPAERFVFVNMRKYFEGQMTSEGPTVERITPEGAVLNQQGLRFLLPRQ